MTKKQIFNSPIKRGMILFAILTLFGTFGYMLIDDYSFMDGLFMTIITVTTVGYGEVRPLSDDGEIFTMILLLISMIMVSYVVGYMTTYLVSGEIREKRLEYKLSKNMEKLVNHIIICGYGCNGRQAALALKNQEKSIVIIENDSSKLALEFDKNMYILHGDATTDEILKKAGIEKAAILLSTLPTDSDNLYVVLTARSMNKDIKIISRASDASYELKIKRAGANEVLLPARLTGNRMAELVLSSEVINFFDSMILHKVEGVDLTVIDLSHLSPQWSDRSLAELVDGKSTIVGIRNKIGDYQFQPQLNMLIKDVDSCLMLTTKEHENDLKQRLANSLS